MIIRNTNIVENNTPIETVETKGHLSELIGKEITAHSKHKTSIGKTLNHAFIDTLSMCFREHRPLSISPDEIWLLICQGFSRHINLDPEKHRSKLVKHQDKIELKVVRDDFVLGGDNPWHEVVTSFSEKIREHTVTNMYDGISKTFSTSNQTTKIAFEITLMSTMGQYFDYSLSTLCGIPSINVQGEKQDYEEIIAGLRFLEEFDLKWWTDSLIEIIREFINVFEGEINLDFWNGIFKHIPAGHNSGDVPLVNGWIVKFFPYMKLTEFFENETYEKTVKNAIFTETDKEFNGIEYGDFGSGLCKSDVKWEYLGQNINLEFYSGFTGLSQNTEDKVISCNIGWIIAQEDSREVRYDPYENLIDEEEEITSEPWFKKIDDKFSNLLS
ncbi:MAG: DUF4419 domain-containing protein [Planctomycetes bacterium]|nr:DUF4419 domain-containing protein [Planctomycetota bacterium]